MSQVSEEVNTTKPPIEMSALLLVEELLTNEKEALVPPTEVLEHGQSVFRFIRTNPRASAPTKHPKLPGYDLKSAVNITVPAYGCRLISTGLIILVPFGCYGSIYPPLSCALQHIDVGPHKIDAKYLDTLQVFLLNRSERDLKVVVGDRIAQLVCEHIFYPKFKEI